MASRGLLKSIPSLLLHATDTPPLQSVQRRSEDLLLRRHSNTEDCPVAGFSEESSEEQYSVLQLRTDMLPREPLSQIPLGPPDVYYVQIEHRRSWYDISSWATRRGKVIGVFHHILGIAVRGIKTIRFYHQDMVEAPLDRAKKWAVHKAVYCAYNIFSGQDVRVELGEDPNGPVQVYSVHSSGCRRGATDRDLQEVYVSSVLRYMALESKAEHSDFLTRCYPSLVVYSPFFMLEDEKHFLQAMFAIYTKPPDLPPHIVYVRLIKPLFQYFSSSYRNRSAIEFFNTLPSEVHRRYPMVAVEIARASARLGEFRNTLDLLARAELLLTSSETSKVNYGDNAAMSVSTSPTSRDIAVRRALFHLYTLRAEVLLDELKDAESAIDSARKAIDVIDSAHCEGSSYKARIICALALLRQRHYHQCLLELNAIRMPDGSPVVHGDTELVASPSDSAAVSDTVAAVTASPRTVKLGALLPAAWLQPSSAARAVYDVLVELADSLPWDQFSEIFHRTFGLNTRKYRQSSTILSATTGGLFAAKSAVVSTNQEPPAHAAPSHSSANSHHAVELSPLLGEAYAALLVDLKFYRLWLEESQDRSHERASSSEGDASADPKPLSTFFESPQRTAEDFEQLGLLCERLHQPDDAGRAYAMGGERYRWEHEGLWLRLIELFAKRGEIPQLLRAANRLLHYSEFLMGKEVALSRAVRTRLERAIRRAVSLRGLDVVHETAAKELHGCPGSEDAEHPVLQELLLEAIRWRVDGYIPLVSSLSRKMLHHQGNGGG